MAIALMFGLDANASSRSQREGTAASIPVKTGRTQTFAFALGPSSAL